MFDAMKVKTECVEWIRDFFEKNGADCNAVVGISGGKDSSIAAALCVEALGKDRVVGVLMPQGEQHDIDMAYLLVNHLGIRHYEVNIKEAVDSLIAALPPDLEVSTQAYVHVICGQSVGKRARGQHLQPIRRLCGIFHPLRRCRR